MAFMLPAFFSKIGAFIVGNWAKIKAAAYLATFVVGVKGYRQAQDMLAQSQAILANKNAAGGKIPVVYGTRRVGAQVVYMDVSGNDSRHLFVVYALSVGECDEVIGRTIELDGNPLTDSARFKYGSYVGSDRNNQTGYNGHQPLNTVSQVGSTVSAGAGQFGTNQNARYRITFNIHHGTATQTADPMLVASMPNWTTAHKLNGICYIAAHYKYDKEGMFSGIPQMTVQVKGKRVYDPRDTNQQFGTPATYKHSDNPALTFLDYITDNQVGKGLTASQINMSTFTSAANVCDTQVDQPYFNGSAQSLTWSATAGNDFFTIAGADANDDWWQNKIGELLDLFDANGNGVLDEVEIKEIQRTQYFGSTIEYIVFINGYFGSDYSSQTGTSLLKVKRFTCNGYLDTNKNVMENAKELLGNMRGVFLYIDGKYELSIEDTGSSTFSINDNHIIADAGISVDYGNKDKRANKVIVEFFNANKGYELDTATVLHNANPHYYSDDGDEILEIKAEFPYITDPYIAYNMGKAILTRSRNQTTMQFLGTPEMFKLNVSDIVDLTYAGLGFSGKVCRVEALELQPNGLVAVSLIEYFDVYTWEVPPQEPVEELANLPSAYAVKAPTGLAFTDTDSSSTGRPFLSWNTPTDFPDYQYRVNVVDSSGNQVKNTIVDVTNTDLNFLPVNANYVASVSSLNTLGSESDSATLTFTIGNAPTGSADIKDDAVITDKIINDAITTPKILNDAVTDAKINSLSANKITAGTIDASQITVTNLNATNITSGTLATARLNVSDIITSGNIIVSGDNISDLTNNSAFINGGQVNTNVTSISGGVITTGTVAAARIDVSGVISAGSIIVSSNLTDGSTSISGGNINTGTINANRLQIDDVTIDTDGSGNLIIKSGGVDTNQIANNAITNDKILANTITADRINVTDLALDFTAATVSGATIGSWASNTMRLKKVADLGTEAGIYHIYCRVFGGNGQVKTLSIVAGDGTFGTTGELDSDFTYSDALFATNLPIADQGYAQFNSGQCQTWSGVDRFDSTYKMVQKDFIVRKTSNTSRTLALYILAQGDGNNRQLSNVQYGFYKFSEI